MIGWYALGVCLLLAVVLGARWFVNADPKMLARIVRAALLIVGGLVLVALALSGQLLVALPLLVIALMMVRAWARGGYRAGAPPSGGQTSEVETDYLKMILDHDSGDMAGQVKRGRFAGAPLSALGLQELLALLDECRLHDEPSVRLLESYIERHHGEDWREGEAGSRAAPSGSAMTREEAYDILGLEKGAGEGEIREAHRKLMQKFHPDRGGSTYLAAKINEAKDVLLRHHA